LDTLEEMVFRFFKDPEKRHQMFPLIRDNKMWLGYGFTGNVAHFATRDYIDYAVAGDHREGMIRVSGAQWFTNMDTSKRHEDLILYRAYTGHEKDYPAYDNYDAIEVGKTADIPMDFEGVMGVPITFLNKFNPEQFEIVGSNRGVNQDPNKVYGRGSILKGKETFKRLFIRNKKVETPK